MPSTHKPDLWWPSVLQASWIPTATDPNQPLCWEHSHSVGPKSLAQGPVSHRRVREGQQEPRILLEIWTFNVSHMVSLETTNTRNITHPPQGSIPRNEEKAWHWTGKSNKLGDQGSSSDCMIHKLCDFRCRLCRICLGSGFSEAEPETGIIVVWCGGRGLLDERG